MKKLATCLLVVGMMALTTFAARADVVTGDMAPDFTLPLAEGGELTLSEHTGSYIVLEWTNHQCPFVVKHYKSNNMQGLQKKWTAQGVKWFSIISSAEGKQGNVTAEEALAIKEENGATPSATLLDPAGDVGRLYGAKTTPHMFVIDPTGKLVYQGAIDSIAGFDPKEIGEGTNYVDLALNKVMAGEALEMHTTKPYGCSVKY